MARKRSNRRPRGRQAGAPRRVVTMSQTEAFEASLSRDDSVALRGKLIQIASVTTTPSQLFVLSAITLGARAAGLAPFFSRFRIKYLRIKFTTIPAILSSTVVNAIAALGLTDDVSTAANPTSVGGVAELRCSATNFSSETVPTFFTWKPLDPRQWYYTITDGDDPRLQYPAILWGAASMSLPVTMEIDYSLTLSGAIDSGAT